MAFEHKTLNNTTRNSNICKICYNETSTNYADCGEDHRVCTNCFDQYIYTKISEYDMSFPCVCHTFFCKKMYTEDMIHKYVSEKTKKIYDIMKRKCCDKFVKCTKCNNDCIKSDKYIHYCKKCKLEWCQVCEKNFCICNINISIENFQTIILSIYTSIMIKRCPECNYASFKEDGCHRVQCTKCKFVWCYHQEIPINDCKQPNYHDSNINNVNAKKVIIENIIVDIFHSNNIFICKDLVCYLLVELNALPKYNKYSIHYKSEVSYNVIKIGKYTIIHQVIGNNNRRYWRFKIRRYIEIIKYQKHLIDSENMFSICGSLCSKITISKIYKDGLYV